DRGVIRWGAAPPRSRGAIGNASERQRRRIPHDDPGLGVRRRREGLSRRGRRVPLPDGSGSPPPAPPPPLAPPPGPRARRGPLGERPPSRKERCGSGQEEAATRFDAAEA